jgi:hypothetical protein
LSKYTQEPEIGNILKLSRRGQNLGKEKLDYNSLKARVYSKMREKHLRVGRISKVEMMK